MRYLNPSALVAVRYLASEAMRHRRPRRAARVRSYAPLPHRRETPLAPTAPPVVPAVPRVIPLDVLSAVLDGLNRLEMRAS